MQIGCGLNSKQIPSHQTELFQLPVLELEDYLYPGFADQDRESLPRIRAALSGYQGTLVLSGPYIDLNPGSPERLIIEATTIRFGQARDFANALGASEIIFLSTFLPFIDLAFYEEDWVMRSIAFWRTFMETVDPSITISLGNTFEFHPDFLVKIVEGVGKPNFRLTFDLGHFLVYGKIRLGKWLQKIQPYCSTVYIHSNDGKVDLHDEPFRGVLRTEDVALATTMLPRETKFIAKMNNKEAMGKSIAWIRQCVPDPSESDSLTAGITKRGTACGI